MNPLLGLLANRVRDTPLGGLLGMQTLRNEVDGAQAPAARPLGPSVQGPVRAPAPVPLAGGPQSVIDGLVRRGLPLHVAQGIAGNFAVESGFDPGINERAPLVPGSRGGFGLAQWTGPRRRQLEAFAQERGAPVSDIDTQLDFLMWEAQGPEARNMRDTLAAPDALTAAQEFMSDFLRPGIPHADRRLAATRELAGGGSMSNASTGGAMPGLLGSPRVSTQGRGLLGGYDPQAPAPLTPMPQAERRPSLWDRLEGKPGLGWLADPDRRAKLAIALEGMTLNPNERMMDMLEAEMGDRDEQERRARTAEWLAQNGAGDLAAILGAGADESAVMGALMQSRQPKEPINAGGGLFLDPDTLQPIADYREGSAGTDDMQEYAFAQGQGFTGSFTDWQTMGSGGNAPETWRTLTPEEAAAKNLPAGGVYEESSRGNLGVVTPAPEGKGGPELSDVTSFQSTYRGEEAVKRMQGLASAYGGLRVAHENNDHMAMVYAYVKMLDPTSVVRETETGMVADSSSIDQSILGEINGWLSGEPLPPQVVERIMRTADGMYNEAVTAFGPVYDSYAGMAEFYGLPPEHGPIDYRRQWDPLPPRPPAPAPEAAPAPAPAPSTTAPAPAPEGAARPVPATTPYPQEFRDSLAVSNAALRLGGYQRVWESLSDEERAEWLD